MEDATLATKAARKVTRRAPVLTRWGGLAASGDGLLWLLHAAVALSEPAYWDASSGADYLAVAAYSAALLGLVPALLASSGSRSAPSSWSRRARTACRMAP